MSYIYNSAVQVIEKRWDGDRYNRDGQNRAGIGTEILGTVGDMFHGNARTFNVSYLLGMATSYSTRAFALRPQGTIRLVRPVSYRLSAQLWFHSSTLTTSYY